MSSILSYTVRFQFDESSCATILDTLILLINTGNAREFKKNMTEFAILEELRKQNTEFCVILRLVTLVAMDGFTNKRD